MRYIFIGLCISFALLLTAIGLSILLEEKIKTIVIEEINSSLNTPVKVEGIDFSIIRHFPYASITFTKINIAGNPFASSAYPLLKAEKVELLFNLFSVFSQSLSLKKIAVDQAVCNILTDKSGLHNYEVFVKKETGNSFSANFESILLNDVSFNTEDKKNKLSVYTTIQKAILKGKFSEEKFTLSVSATLLTNLVSYSAIAYVKNKPTELNGKLEIDTRKNSVEMNDLNLKLANLNLAVNGNVRADEATTLNLKISATHAAAQELLSSLPSGWIKPQLLDYTYKGSVFFDLDIHGIASDKKAPVIALRFGTKNTDIIPDKTQYALRNVSLEGYYTNLKSPANPTSFLQLKKIHAMVEGKSVSGDITLENLNNPWVDIALDAEFSMATLSRYLPQDFTENQEGNISFHGTIKGKADKMDSYRSSGTLQLSGIRFKLKSKALEVNEVNGRLMFVDANVTVQNLRARVGQSDFTINASIKNLYRYLFIAGETISINGQVNSSFIDAAELFTTTSISTDTTAVVFEFPSAVEVNATIESKQIRFKKFEASDFIGNVLLKNKSLAVNNVRFDAVNGNVSLDGTVTVSAKDSLLITCHASLRKLNMEKLFYEMGNFGQQTLTDKNIRGLVTADVNLASAWSKTLTVNPNRIFANCSIVVDDGALINFSPLLKLSRFIKGTDLRHVQFSTLTNQIKIEHQKIYIPSMEIKSSALNIAVNGEHSFDNVVNYAIQMKLSELLGKKVRQQNTEFGVIENQQTGNGLNLMLTMKGPLENPQFAYDRKSVEKHITHSLKAGKDDFIKTLKEEFSGKKPDSSTTTPDKKKKELEIDWD